MRTQKGSLMIEVIAVLGLIALITPVLFRQIARRNEDIVAMQVASEMRAVKDALAAYIQAYEQNIAENCDLGSWVEDDEDDEDKKYYKYKEVLVEKTCRGDAIKADVLEFYAGGLDAGEVMMEDYGLGIYGYTVPANVEISDTEEIKIYRPVLYGVVYQKVSEETLRMASKIAGLIGLDGGVVLSAGEKVRGLDDDDGDGLDERSAVGVQAAWVLPVPADRINVNSVVAVTSFDDATNTAILKDVKLENFVGETMQATTSTSSRMAIANLLSVGDGANCILNPENSTVQVVGRGEKDGESNVIAPNCAPLFEVNAADGVVRLAGVLTGEEIGKGNCADLKTKATCEAAAYCTWDAKAKDGENNTGVCEARHKIDLSAEGISSMHDIKLTSRGGAKLSDLLPTYSLKGYERIKASPTEIAAFDCGAGGEMAFVVVPTSVNIDTSLSGTTISFMQKDPYELNNGNYYLILEYGIKEAILYKYCVFKDGTTATPAN